VNDVPKQQRRLWSVAEAKAHLSDVIERARNEGPQEISRHGKRAAVVVSVEEWDRKTQRKGSLVDFLGASPLRGSGLQVKRLRDRPRKLEL
jgi:prevent-host-death family protein